MRRGKSASDQGAVSPEHPTLAIAQARAPWNLYVEQQNPGRSILDTISREEL